MPPRAGGERGRADCEGGCGRGVPPAVGEAPGPSAPLTEAEGEPMINLLCTHTGPGWRLILFPRRKHRPDAYFREGEGKLLVSPGAVDMSGLLITSREADFLAMNPEIVQGIFREVAFGDAEVDALLDLL